MRVTSRLRSALALALACGVLTSISCKGFGGGGERRPDEVELAVKRGAAWTTFTLRPGRIIGASANIDIRRGKMRGFLDGEPLRLEVTQDEIRGIAGGRVQIDIEEYEGRLEAGGTWNDDRLHVIIAPDVLRGTVTGAFRDQITNRPLGQCQFVLDKLLADGERIGTSICRGMPENTRLIFPKEVERWLTRGEAVAVLIALLSSAPPSSTD